MTTKEKILVTGVAGFIGSKVAELLLKNGYSVVGVDNINNYYSPKLKFHRLNLLQNFCDFQFYNIDVENFVELEELFASNKFVSVINLAARAGVRASIENPYIYVSTNIVGTLNLLELMRKYSINKFVLASSSSVYAGEKVPFRENMRVDYPISQYAATKKSAELLSYTYHHLYAIDVSVLRFFTVFGPAGRPDMSYFQFIEKIRKGIPITIYGDGSQKRDFTYIEDIANGVLSSMKPLGYEIINLGGGRSPVSINYMIELIENTLHRKALIEYQPFNNADMSETGADISKAKVLLGWQPEIDFETGMNNTIKWHLQNESLLNSL
ncbi:MAG: GDP-mannose 4,6-dehydratase [Ignavibacteria bacterium]|nr:GDP-mannose 4,6-dehydratase [Ignavibacteria bacterium]